MSEKDEGAGEVGWGAGSPFPLSSSDREVNLHLALGSLQGGREAQLMGWAGGARESPRWCRQGERWD